MRERLGFLASLTTVALAACGGEGDPVDESFEIVNWMVEQGSFSPLHGLPGIPTNCGAAEPFTELLACVPEDVDAPACLEMFGLGEPVGDCTDLDIDPADWECPAGSTSEECQEYQCTTWFFAWLDYWYGEVALPGATCSDVSHYEFTLASDDSFVWTEYEYIYRFTDPVGVDDYFWKAPYFAENTLTGGLVFTGSIKEIPNVSPDVAVQMTTTITDAFGPDEYFAGLIGTPSTQIFARGTADDVLLSWTMPEDGSIAFPGFAIEVGPSGAFLMKACNDKVADSGTPGYCAPSCRMGEAGNGLPVCDSTTTTERPRAEAFNAP